MGFDTLLCAAIRQWISDSISKEPEIREEALADLSAARQDPAAIELIAMLAGATWMRPAEVLENIARQIEIARLRPEPGPKPKILPGPKPAPKKVGRPRTVRPTFKVKTGRSSRSKQAA